MVEDLHNRAITGQPVQLADVESLLASKTDEGDFLEYKGGGLLSRHGHSELRTAKAKLRKEVAALSNHRGGLLVLGANGGDVSGEEEPWSVQPCPPKIGRQPVAEWIADVIEDLSPRMSVPPRIRTIDAPPGVVVLVALEAALDLLPVSENGRNIFYYRDGSVSVRLHPDLVLDVRSGRRARPVYSHEVDVRIREPSLQGTRTMGPEYDAYVQRLREPYPFSVQSLVQNVSLAFADDVLLGCIAPTSEPGGSTVPSRLLEWLDISLPSGWGLRHEQRRLAADLPPFESARETVSRAGEVPPVRTLDDWREKLLRERDQEWVRDHGGPPPGRLVHPISSEIETLAALFVLSRGCPPVWYQLRIRTQYGTMSGETETDLVRTFARPRVALVRRARLPGDSNEAGELRDVSANTSIPWSGTP